MSHRITTDDVAHIAHLARLSLDEREIEQTTAELGAMLEHFAAIDALDLSEVDPMPYPYPLQNVFRDDQVRTSLDRDEVLDAAPAVDDGQFQVPPAGAAE